jgi:hypothetical protein
MESAIAQISNDLSTVCVTLQERSRDQQSVDLSEDSEELTEIAAGMVSLAGSVVSSVSSQASTVRPSPRGANWTSMSLDGMPVGPQMRQRIHEWRNMTPVGSASASSTSASRPPIASSVSSFTYIANEDEDADLDAKIRIDKRRYIYAMDLCKKRKFEQAIPYIKNTLESFTDATERSIRRSALMLYIQAHLELPKFPDVVPKYLKDALQNSDQDEMHEVLHLQAQVEIRMYPQNPDMAKQTCIKAINARSSLFGWNHKLTVESKQLMTDICVLSRDQDAAIWATEQGVTKIWHPEEIFEFRFSFPILGIPAMALLAIIGGCGIGWCVIFFGIPWLGVLSLKRNWVWMMNWKRNGGGVAWRVCLYAGSWLILLGLYEEAIGNGEDMRWFYTFSCCWILGLAFIGLAGT